MGEVNIVMKRCIWIMIAGLVLNAAVWAEDKIQDVDQLAAKCAAGNRKACEKLNQWALAHTNYTIHCQAIRRATDPSVLAAVALKDESREARRIAVERITDQSVLAKVALEDRMELVRRAAVERLSEPAALVRVAIEDDDEATQLLAVARLDDPEGLIQVVREAKTWNIRNAAIVRITDPVAMARLALDAPNPEIREAAVERINDPAVLARIALGDQQPDVRRAAVGRIDDPAVLVRVAAEDAAWDVRRAAVGRIDDQLVLNRMAAEDPNWNVRKAAAGKLIDPSVLARVATQDPEPSVREAAVRRLDDQTVLAKVATDDAVPAVRDTAIERLADSGLLASLAEAEKSIIRRARIIARMSDTAPQLVDLSGNPKRTARDTPECLARLKRATQEPIVQSRCPGLFVELEIAEISSRGKYSGELDVRGETVTIALRRERAPAVKMTWQTSFPPILVVPETAQTWFVDANADGGALLVELFRSGPFAHEDLVRAGGLCCPKFWAGVVVCLSEPSPLARVALEDDVPKIRAAAAGKLTDQAVLAVWHERMPIRMSASSPSRSSPTRGA